MFSYNLTPMLHPWKKSKSTIILGAKSQHVTHYNRIDLLGHKF